MFLNQKWRNYRLANDSPVANLPPSNRFFTIEAQTCRNSTFADPNVISELFLAVKILGDVKMFVDGFDGLASSYLAVPTLFARLNVYVSAS